MGKIKFASPNKERGVGFMDTEKSLAGVSRLSDPDNVRTKREDTNSRLSWPATMIYQGVSWIHRTFRAFQ